MPDPDERRGEVRLPAAAAVVAAIALSAVLPRSVLVGPRFVIPAVEAVLLIPLIAINPRRLTRETRWSRKVSLSLTLVIIAANTGSLGLLLHQLTSLHPAGGRTLLVAALQIWFTNIVAFALMYWELDRGGPIARNELGPSRDPDFRFPQDDAQETEWRPTFVDYFYVSITNSTAFSPTDAMPMTSRLKLLMSVQAMAALITSLLVIARAVNTLQ
jgi:uncharacterized membrane protein